jgi:hypothetical protein
LTRVVCWREAIRSESTLYIIAEGDDGRTYVIKYVDGGDGVKTIIVDWLSCRLAALLGIPVPILAPIEIGPALLPGDLDSEVSVLVHKCLEFNPVLAFLQRVPGSGLPGTMAQAGELAGSIFLFDILIGNLDRTRDNPDTLRSNSCLFFHDFSRSITMRSAIDGRDPVVPQFISVFRRHPFFKVGIAAERFRRRVLALSDDSLAGIAASVPPVWLQRLSPGLSEDDRNARVLRALHLVRDRASGLDAYVAGIERSSADPDAIRVSRKFGNTRAFLGRIVQSDSVLKRG